MNSKLPEELPNWVFDTAFPFSFAWDSTGRIIHCGRSLERFLVQPSVGRAVTDLFCMTRPAGLFDAEWLNAHQSTLMLIDVLGTSLMLRGQVIAIAAGGPWLFAGSPWLTSPEQLNTLGLSMADFAPHDSTVDMLYVVQTQRVGNRELKDLNHRLNEQGKQLVEKEQQARKLALVAEKTSGAVTITDQAGRIEWVNDSFTAMTGWSLEEIRGRKPGAFLQGEHTDRTMTAHMRDQVAKGLGFTVEILNYRKNGTPFLNCMEVQPVTAVSGQVSHFIAHGSDVTARKLKEINSRIEAVVADVIMAGSHTQSIIPACLERLAETLGATLGKWWCNVSHGQGLVLKETWSPRETEGMVSSNLTSLALRAKSAGSSQWQPVSSESGVTDNSLISGLAIPVAVEKRIFGVLEFYLGFVIPPDDEMLESLTRLGSQIGLILKRLEAEEAYKEAERIAHLGNWNLDVLTGKMEWSDEKYRIHGYEPQEIPVDMDFCLRSIHPDDVESVRSALTGSIATGLPMKAIYRIRRPSGDIRHLKCNAEPLLNTDGSIATLIGTVMDITELEHARSALRETEERWQLALESTGLGVWDWDLESGSIIYTDALLAMLGYQSEDWEKAPESWTTRVHPDDLSMASSAMQLCLKGELKQYVSEHRMLCKNGAWKWVRHSGRVVATSPSGKALRLVGTQMDIQIRKSAEQSAGKRAELINQIRDAQGHFIAAASLERVFAEMIRIALSHSESAVGFILRKLDDGSDKNSMQCYGIPQFLLNDETVGLLDLESADGSRYLTYKDLYSAALHKGEAVIAHKNISNSGEGCDNPSDLVSFLGLPVFHGLEIVGMLGLANRVGGYDQDFIKELDPFIAAISSMIVADRELTRRRAAEEELRAACDRAEAANRAKGNFLAMMSHEIRTPMNGVLGMASLLRETNLSPPQIEMVDTVIQSGGALVRIIDDILDFSKVDAGLIRLKLEQVSFEELLDGVVDLLAQEAAAKGLELITIIHADLPPSFLGDVGRLRQILLNLMGNAVKFTEHGFVAVRVAPVNDGLEFSVIDSGIGVSPESTDLIFLPFRQIDSSASRSAGGTGLGLAICKKLVRMMGGRMGVSSGNSGSQFWFRIPFSSPIPTKLDDPSTPREQTSFWIADPMPLVREAILMAMGGEHSAALEIATYDELVLQMNTKNSLPNLLFIDKKWITPVTQAWLEEKWALHGQQQPSVIFTRCETRCDGRGHRCLGRPLRRRSIREVVFPEQKSHLAAPAAIIPNTPLGLRVLIAEDNPINATLIKLYLDKIGCDWILAKDGIEALMQFEKDHFDAILMDCQMPGMDGYEATKQIRSLEATQSSNRSKVGIIAVTANALEGERTRCLEAGMDDYIAKPFGPQSLAEILLKNTNPNRPPQTGSLLEADQIGNQHYIQGKHTL